MATSGAPLRVLVQTLGCRVNRYDGAAIAADLASRGYELVDDDAETCDVYVLNSCAVTGAAEAEGRRLLARARHAGSLVVATGCAAEVSGPALRAHGAAELIVGAAAKPALGALLDERLGRTSRPGPDTALAIDGRSSRFFYKIQEGCDVRCAFCIIPDARGAARSVPPDEVVATLHRARVAGFREVVLAGIHLGGYGRDLSGVACSLAQLCRRVLDETGLERVRLGSIEPWGLRPDLVALLREEPRLMPFLHVPLQSGSNHVLRLMRRPISAAGYLRAVERALEARPETAIFLDVMVGFPGEGDAELEETVALLARFDWVRLHVFPYSERPGTPAARLDRPRAPAPVARARVRRLIDWSVERFRARLEARCGSFDEVVVEAAARGHTRDNLPVRLLGDAPARRALAAVRLERVEETAAGPLLCAAVV